MFLYLVQHAQALPEDVDPSRSLSEKGIEDVKKVAGFISRLDIKPQKIFHSGKMRALQTAQIIAEHLKIEDTISQTDGLAPMDDPEIWFKRLKNIQEDTMLVGHLPHLGKLCGLLLCGSDERTPVAFKMGGIVCLKSSGGVWAVEWMIIPEVMK
jgi:phosphohistidine phosphatase